MRKHTASIAIADSTDDGSGRERPFTRSGSVLFEKLRALPEMPNLDVKQIEEQNPTPQVPVLDERPCVQAYTGVEREPQRPGHRLKHRLTRINHLSPVQIHEAPVWCDESTLNGAA